MRTYKANIVKADLPAFQQNYLAEDMLLFDIETTGLSPARHQIYCIGCGYVHSESISIELFFADEPDDELLILERFYHLLDRHRMIITFNGTVFDIPFIKKRTELLLSPYDNHSEPAAKTAVFPDEPFCMPHMFHEKESYDLYREVKKLKDLLELSSYKQKSLEQFLGCYREDQYDGGQLIALYQEYVKQPTQEVLDLLLLHNLEDVKGMFDLLGILSYRQFIKGHFRITDIIPETDENREYLNVKLIPEYPLPQSLRRFTDHAAVLMAKENTLIRFPVHHGILKHFFPDPENYYYLPEEDTAVHKSIGEYVDPSHRKRANRKNCYIKKECDYILIPVKSEYNLLRKEYNDNDTYLELPVQDQKALKEFLQKLFRLYIK